MSYPSSVTSLQIIKPAIEKDEMTSLTHTVSTTEIQPCMQVQVQVLAQVNASANDWFDVLWSVSVVFACWEFHNQLGISLAAGVNWCVLFPSRVNKNQILGRMLPMTLDSYISYYTPPLNDYHFSILHSPDTSWHCTCIYNFSQHEIICMTAQSQTVLYACSHAAADLYDSPIYLYYE